MDELIKEALENYFSDFKEYHLIILISFTIVIALIQIIQSIIVTRKIERFKNDLKKSEIKFSRFNELQITALRKIYHLLTSFHHASNLILRAEKNSIGHSQFKARIDNWITAYFNCANEFSKEKILLTAELKELYIRTLSDFEEVKKILLSEKAGLEEWEMIHHQNRNAMYEYKENELSEISQQIDKLKDLDSTTNSLGHIKELRKKIEEIFSKMN